MRNAIVVGIVLIVTGSNAWMTWYLSRDQREPAPPPPRAEAAQTSPTPAIRANKIFRPERRSTETARPPWLFLESDDYRTYAANLRAVGCPEKTVRDIIVADIGKAFAGQERALFDRSEDPFWMTADQREELDLERARQKRELTTAKWELLRELFGQPVDHEVLKLVRSDGMTQAALWLVGGFVEREKIVRLLGLVAYHEFRARAIHEQAHGILLDEDYEQARALRASMERQAVALVGGAAMEEIHLRLVLSRNNDFGVFQYGVNLSGTEFRNLMKIRAAAEDLYTKLFEQHGFQELREEAVSEEQIETAMARYLGSERFADYTRAKDERFQEIYRFATANGLSKQEAIAVFDARDRAETDLKRIAADGSLAAEEHVLLQAAVKTRLEADLRKHFGAVIAKEYRTESIGQWVDELITAPKPTPPAP